MIKIKIKLLQQYRLIENFFTFPSHKEIISKLFHCDFTYVLSLYIIASQHLTVQGYDYTALLMRTTFAVVLFNRIVVLLLL